ncbi:hypothetical protein FSP39_014538 [Pinctada imbricata]|uniref:NF-X1-type zinc finger protein NFXL1 n=1 Tax=Pinctada imbricata TaxID=66713 RepID=A0AA89C3T7_PINIB|nr:hypothetical protein FSP39_014538 [Pinctada imbricata]
MYLLDPGQFDSTSAEKKFAEISSQHQQAIQHHLDHSDDVNSDLSPVDEEDINDNILNSVFKTYSTSFGNDINGDTGDTIQTVDRAQTDLVHTFRSSASACLICIENIKKNEAIWNCQCCYAMFHIQCIQKWVREGVYQHAYKTEGEVDTKDIPWHCPKCRSEYKQADCPKRYFCFCGKVQDPSFDPWLVPHSCGQMCGKALKPECGHTCLLLCHPGACPPCPKTIQTKCHCGKQKPKVVRCSVKTWSCGQPCGRKLSCNQHYCKLPCHSGDCPACPMTSKQSCMCGKSSTTRPCASPQWQCDEPCGKLLSCKSHVCERRCHGDQCGACPRAGIRKCPCGKTEFELPCTEDIPTCGDTCGQLLDCGIHTCSQRCHTGPCGACRQMTKKRCRCGQKSKEVPCYKEYLCETKCTIMKDCKKHQCKRKCCDGNCPTCEQVCGKQLSCKNHKCDSRCHRGPCYPCPLTKAITCFCGGTKITVPCGKEKVTRPPRCNIPCKIPPSCHHPTSIPHRCHFNDCPPCRQICGKSLEKCQHLCPVMCHTAIKVLVKENVAKAGPWEGKPVIRQEVIKKPCPPCMVPMATQCLGLHEVLKIPCSELRPLSCGRKCGRTLACTNHTCTKECHVVDNAPDSKMHGDNCEECSSPCLVPRPEGCVHPCPALKCHPGVCPPCKQMIRMRCHCEAMVQHVSCHEWVHADAVTRDKLKACAGECPKILPCSHPCGAPCHPGKCPTGQCKKKVNLRCACRRKKGDAVCMDLKDGKRKLDCDDICEREKLKKKKDEEEKENARLEEEKLKQQAELEEFERKMKGRKRKPRKETSVQNNETFLSKHKKLLIAAIVIPLLGIFAIYLISQ